MPIVIGQYALINEPITWKIGAGVDTPGGPFILRNATVPIDLTGYTARGEIKTDIRGALLATLTTENGGIVIDPLLGKVTLWCPRVQSRTWPSNIKKGVFDVELYDSSDVATRLLWGIVDISPNVTTGDI